MQQNELSLNANNLPISTQWTIEAAGESRNTIPFSYMIICRINGSKGSGFLLNNGYLVTNLHVITGNLDKVLNKPLDEVLKDIGLQNVFAISSSGEQISFSNWFYVDGLDLIILKPSNPLEGGLELDITQKTRIGEQVYTWGYPLSWNGPAPLFSTGYLAGFKELQTKNGKYLKRLVVNGAFNSGNSGGALFSIENKVIGVVVEKHLPLLSPFHQQALQALMNNKTGVTFTETDNQGNATQFVESQIVADILIEYWKGSQVMIGEAISSLDLQNLFQHFSIKI